MGSSKAQDYPQVCLATNRASAVNTAGVRGVRRESSGRER